MPARKGPLEANKKQLEEIGNLIDQLNESSTHMFEDPSNNIGRLSTSIGNVKDLFSETISITNKLKNNQKEIAEHGSHANRLSTENIRSLEKQLSVNKQKLAQEKESLKQLNESNRQQLANAESLGLTTQQQNDLTTSINQSNAAQERLNEAVNATNDAQLSANKQFAKAKGFETKEKVLNATTKAANQFGTAIENALGFSLNPIDMLVDAATFAIAQVVNLDKELGESAKSMNQTYVEAAKSRAVMIDLAQASGNLLINGTQINKTFTELNKTLGTNVAFEKLSGSLQKNIAFMGMLEEFAGLTAEESNNILKYSLQIHKPAKETVSILMAQYRAYGAQNKLVLNEKDILREIGTISESIKISIEGGAKGLAKTAAAAKVLGTKLSTVESIQSGLLNFEESIEKEMAAELMLGRDINLEKARFLAINNDIAGLAEEIKIQAGTQQEFGEMNYLTQMDFAAALHLTKEQMAELLNTQVQQAEISKEAGTAEEQAYQALVARHGEQGALGILAQQQVALLQQQVSLADKVNAAKKKETDNIHEEAIPGLIAMNASFESMLAKLEDIFAMFGKWRGILFIIAGIMGAGMALSIVKYISGLRSSIALTRTLAILSANKANADVVSSSYSMAATLGAAGLAVALPMIAAGIAYIVTSPMADGIISPSSGGGGYGSRMLFGPEGAISFNNKDTIVAGTNLFPKKVNDYSTSEGALSLNPEKSMNELTSAILSLASRPIDIYIEGEKIIKATTGNLPNVAALSSAQNSYEIS